MRSLDYKPGNNPEATIADLRKQLADTKAELQRAIDQLNTNTSAGIAPISNLIQTVNNLNARVSQIQSQQGSVVPTISDLNSITTPQSLSRVSCVETGLRYEFKSGIYVAGIPGRIDKSDGVWTPVNWIADPNWVKSIDYPNNFQRTLKGATVSRVSFEVAQKDDRSKFASFDITDFVTGCTQNGYWGIMGRNFDQTIVDRTIRVFIGVDTTLGKVIVIALDPNIAGNFASKACWIRNIKINGLPADLTDGLEIARLSFPKS